jgi:DNA-binding response OmpR family regulator
VTSAPPNNPTTNHRILIIDDDDEIRETVRYALTSQGYEVFVAVDGNEGLAMAEVVNPDLVLLDMMMPKRSGFLVLEQIGQVIEKPIRVIMMTANEGQRHKAYAETLGVSDYLHKPFAIEAMLESVKRILEEPVQ